jgi:hypothetical protein
MQRSEIEEATVESRLWARPDSEAGEIGEATVGNQTYRSKACIYGRKPGLPVEGIHFWAEG